MQGGVNNALNNVAETVMNGDGAGRREKKRYERREMRGGGGEGRGLGRWTNEGKHGANLGGPGGFGRGTRSYEDALELRGFFNKIAKKWKNCSLTRVSDCVVLRFGLATQRRFKVRKRFQKL